MSLLQLALRLIKQGPAVSSLPHRSSGFSSVAEALVWLQRCRLGPQIVLRRYGAEPSSKLLSVGQTIAVAGSTQPGPPFQSTVKHTLVLQVVVKVKGV